jgi:hypothetical protein
MIVELQSRSVYTARQGTNILYAVPLRHLIFYAQNGWFIRTALSQRVSVGRVYRTLPVEFSLVNPKHMPPGMSLIFSKVFLQQTVLHIVSDPPVISALLLMLNAAQRSMHSLRLSTTVPPKAADPLMATTEVSHSLRYDILVSPCVTS